MVDDLLFFNGGNGKRSVILFAFDIYVVGGSGSDSFIATVLLSICGIRTDLQLGMPKAEFNENPDEGTDPCHWQRQPQLRDKRRKMKVRLASKGPGYGETMMSVDRCFSCTTFNILAPIYKRLDKEVRDHH